MKTYFFILKPTLRPGVRKVLKKCRILFEWPLKVIVRAPDNPYFPFQAGRCAPMAERQNVWRYSSPEDGSDGLARRGREGVHQGKPDVGERK